MSEVAVKKTLPKGVYVCPDCGNRVHVLVRLVCAPECTLHNDGPKRMEAK